MTCYLYVDLFYYKATKDWERICNFFGTVKQREGSYERKSL